MKKGHGVAGQGRFGRWGDDLIVMWWNGPAAKTSAQIAAMIEAGAGRHCSFRWVQNRALYIGLCRDTEYRMRNLRKSGGRPRKVARIVGPLPPLHHERPILAGAWPAAAMFADVGRLDLIREMLPLSRFRYMPAVPLRASGCGSSMAMV